MYNKEKSKANNKIAIIDKKIKTNNKESINLANITILFLKSKHIKHKILILKLF